MGCNCPDGSNCIEKVSDQCVIYTGEDIDALDICNGMTLSSLEAIILEKLQAYALGEGITLSGITANCDFVTQSLANKDKNLFNLLQTLFDNDCSLRELITEVQNNQEQPYSFDLKCLTVSNPTRDNITQELINQLCAVQTTVTNIVEQLENPETEDNTALITAVTNLMGNMLGTNISACPTSSIQKTGSGAATNLKLVGFVPLNGIIFYAGSIGNFDQTGKGLASACLDNFAIANGSNGTIDLRGYGIAGATNVVGGNLLSGAVIAGDADTQTNVGNRKGTPKVTLTSVNQIPDHYHVLTDPGHAHTYVKTVSGSSYGDNSKNQTDSTVSTSTSTTGITIGGIQNRTASQSIENRQPTYYGIFIQRIS